MVPEIGVASTKAFLGQILVLYILALKLGSLRKEIEKKEYQEKIRDLKDLPGLNRKNIYYMIMISRQYLQHLTKLKVQCF